MSLNFLWRTPSIERFLLWLAFLLILSFTARTCLFEFYLVPTSSMAPNYNEGDLIFIWRMPYLMQYLGKAHLPGLGQVIMHRMPEDSNQVSIKRVLGVSGNTVAVDNQQVYWNKQELKFELSQTNYQIKKKLDEGTNTSTDHYDLGWELFPGELKGVKPYQILRKTVADDAIPVKMGKRVVPNGHVFLLGDNRSQSYDSRQFGFVNNSLVIGDVLAKGRNWSELLRTLSKMLRSKQWK